MPISIGTQPRQLRIMFAGDSITSGTTDVGGQGFREGTIRNIISRIGSRARFVGNSTGSGGGVMCGTSGLRVDELNATPYLTDQLPQLKPDIILLHIGTNDCTQLQSGGTPTLATSRANLTTLLDNIRTQVPNCIVFICRIIDNNTAHTEVVNYNTNAIDTDVVARSDYTSGKIKIVDMYTGVGLYDAANYADGSHPNAAGFALMTTTWTTNFNLYY